MEVSVTRTEWRGRAGASYSLAARTREGERTVEKLVKAAFAIGVVEEVQDQHDPDEYAHADECGATTNEYVGPHGVGAGRLSYFLKSERRMETETDRAHLDEYEKVTFAEGDNAWMSKTASAGPLLRAKAGTNSKQSTKQRPKASNMNQL